MPGGVTRATLPGMTHIPPPAEELRLLDAELYQLDARRAQLLTRRAWLVAQLNPVPRWQSPPTAARPEASAPSVQNVLLVLGGALLTLAATAFTLVSWGQLGIAGRAVILGGVTLAALAAPLPLLRRGLRSTAEAVAGLGLALTVLDAYALYEVALGSADGTGYAATASAALAVAWAGYGRALTGWADPGLRLPLPAALAAAQLTLPLGAVAVDAGAYGVTAALLLTAGWDTVVALRVSAGAVRVVATVGAYGMGGWGVLAAGWLSWTASGPSAAARAAALLLLAAAIALGAAWRGPGPALGNAVAGGLVVTAGLAGVPHAVLSEAWTVPVHLVCGVALLAVVRVDRVPQGVRAGLAWASGAVQALAVLWALPVVMVAVLGPAAWVTEVWSGAPGTARDAVTDVLPWPPDAALAPVVLAVVAAVVVLLVRAPQWRPRALAAATTLAWAAVLILPATLGLPYAAALLAQALVTAALLALRRTTATVLALLTSLGLALLSLAAEPATLAVLAFLTALFATAARLPVPAATAVVYATVLACATGASVGWEPRHIALLVLLVPAVAALWAARVEGATRVTVEVTGAVAGLVAVGLAVTDPPVLALVLALAGVITAATAVRADRRPVGCAAAVLFLLATWVRLAAWEVTTPEAYTLPVSVPALLVGALRRRRDPAASSWTAYGPGLAATLVPSLLAAWGDADWQRPLLLGAAALAVTLLGARHRLQAPLVLGGTVLGLTALHELAPHIAQVVGALPRWVPPALAGLVLLAAGATYEQWLRDARRVREVFRGLG
ncbi:SCO7613 C-terminal domain-containing membrane protein [Streptomyces sp. NPDC057877]|uniref:SCO7613 C-terminal domain-containing membrane protein n=1 Tax=Streptomyces sp. NPDC057877 TaxID=3346269 RepID=UPI0036758C31